MRTLGRSRGGGGGGGEGGNDGGGCLGWVVAAIVGFALSAVFVGLVLLIVYAADRPARIAARPAMEAEYAKLTRFLADHGDVVTMVGMQDEFKKVRQGKRMVTRENVWLICRFKDGYVIEVPQRHEDPTARVPQEGESWRLAVRKSEYRAWFELAEKID
jgi:hypothetical protein